MTLVRLSSHDGGTDHVLEDNIVMVSRAVFDPRLSISAKDFVGDEIVLVYRIGRRLPVRVDNGMASIEWLLDNFYPLDSGGGGIPKLLINSRYIVGIGDYPAPDGAKIRIDLQGDITIEAWGSGDTIPLEDASPERPVGWEEVLRRIDGWRVRFDR